MQLLGDIKFSLQIQCLKYARFKEVERDVARGIINFDVPYRLPLTVRQFRKLVALSIFEVRCIDRELLCGF